MPGKQGVRSPIDGPPKFVLREFLGRQPFREQAVKFFGCSLKPRHGALFDGGQSGLYDFLDRLVSTPTNDFLDPPLLFWREMNGHGDSAAPLRCLSPLGYEKNYSEAMLRLRTKHVYRVLAFGSTSGEKPKVSLWLWAQRRVAWPSPADHYAAGGMFGTSSNPSSCAKGRNTEKAVPLFPARLRLAR